MYCLILFFTPQKSNNKKKYMYLCTLVPKASIFWAVWKTDGTHKFGSESPNLEIGIWEGKKKIHQIENVSNNIKEF